METYKVAKAPPQCKRCQRNCGYTPRCVACGEPRLSGECSASSQHLKCCSCGGNHTANYRGCSSKWKEAKAALAKRAPIARTGMNGANVRPATSQAARAGPSAEEESLGPGWSHVVRGGRVMKATLPPPSEPIPRPVAEVPQQDKATEPRKEVISRETLPTVTHRSWTVVFLQAHK